MVAPHTMEPLVPLTTAIKRLPGCEVAFGGLQHRSPKVRRSRDSTRRSSVTLILVLTVSNSRHPKWEVRWRALYACAPSACFFAACKMSRKSWSSVGCRSLIPAIASLSDMLDSSSGCIQTRKQNNVATWVRGCISCVGSNLNAGVDRVCGASRRSWNSLAVSV